METQQLQISLLLASSVGAIISSQNTSKPPFLSSVPTSTDTVITISSYGFASLSTQLGVSQPYK
jgi:hypothetical protein